MSFRARLSLFFVLIAIVPMVSLTFVLSGLIADSENGKADAGIAARQEAAIGLVELAQERAGRGIVALGRDVALATALQRGRPGFTRARAQALLRPLGLKRIVVGPVGGAPVVDVGSRTAVFPAARPLQDARGRSYGVIRVSAEGPRAYAAAVLRGTRLDAVVRRNGRLLASTRPAAARAELPRARGDVEVDGTRFRASTFTAPAFPGSRLEVTLLAASDLTSGQVRESRLIAGGILLGFFVLAFAFAVLVSRSLHRQIEDFLVAARRLGCGDFSTRVPIEGGDEFAELGREFNRMSDELEQRLADLRAEQERLAGAMRRVGETFAANLDRDGLLRIVLRTALDGAGATGGRAGLRDAPGASLVVVAEEGELSGLEPVLAEAEAVALAQDTSTQPQHDGASALAHPFRALDGEEAVTGVVSVARVGAAFTASERELFEYLARQAAVSIENIGLHETVERQAVKDELTGLANRRRFQEVLAVVLPGTDEQGAFDLAERVRHRVAGLAVRLPAGGGIRVTASFGVATHPQAAAGAEQLLQAADDALYEAKRAGKNRTVRPPCGPPA